MSGSGPDTLPDVRKVLLNACKDFPDVREWSGGPPECPGVVGRPSRMSKCGRVALTDVRQWSGWPSQMSGSGREAFPDVRE